MLEEIELYAHENKVPIMMPDGIEYLCNYIKEHNIVCPSCGKQNFTDIRKFY